ncbi:inactive hydroxysteroid dehydrogenase-like protein 1 isoform X2 [Aplysia californica]|uniref:Inactive hydroxysteroid dehydrogenase-like protein 1 isoform X2 n=1 Tax=Aplysia californica TaxID=6500 RepID=A0ABM0JMN3_APLCA|nr:inactive hydroxysteroid dehydrogenase-like protein 1 isoform X2 [Aplysia californica]
MLSNRWFGSFRTFSLQLTPSRILHFSDFIDVFAFLGAYYFVKKCLKTAALLTDTVNAHVLSRLRPYSNEWWMESFGPWAVVTGSSEGIGQAYAYELARRGLNVVLISENERRLRSTQVLLEGRFAVKVEYIVVDFASADQTEVYNRIWEVLEDKDIGLLVNNVGVSYRCPDVLLSISREDLWRLIYVNIGAATMMTHMLLPGMVKQGRGGLVVVSAGSSTQITPQMTVYSATKRYLDYFIQGVAYEYRHSGLTFQCLMPFYVNTRMTGFSDTLTRSRGFFPSAKQYASNAILTLGRASLTTGYFYHTLQLWLAWMLPSGLWMWGSEKLNNALRREAQNRALRRVHKSASDETMVSVAMTPA